eukprot:scaffold25362_cov19-Tisochrysis_lutea.AAC.1
MVSQAPCPLAIHANSTSRMNGRFVGVNMSKVKSVPARIRDKQAQCCCASTVLLYKHCAVGDKQASLRKQAAVSMLSHRVL